MSSFIFRNIEYKSLKDCFDKFGVNSSAFTQYYNRYNFSSKQQGLENYLLSRRTSFVFRDREYKSFRSCCKEFGVNYFNVNEYAIYHNVSKQEALEHCLTNETIFVFRGVKYKSFAECCKVYGFHRTTIYKYIDKMRSDRELTKQEALEHCIKKGIQTSFNFRGQEYKSFSSCCKEFGFKDKTIYARSKKYNISKQKALEYYLNKKK